MNDALSSWQLWAVLSAVFAALTAIFAKVGVETRARRISDRSTGWTSGRRDVVDVASRLCASLVITLSARFGWASRSFRLSWFSVAALVCGLIVPAFAQTAAERPAQSQDAPTQREVACPSQNFRNFLEAFSESAMIQRKFAQFPLQFEQLDSDAPSGATFDEMLKRRVIGKFEDVPTFSKRIGRIFATKGERAKQKVKTEIELRSDNANVELHVPDTGFRIFFRFRKTGTCWFLYAISDQST